MTTAGNEMRRVGRYALYGELASGGMAAVHLGRMLGPVGFARTVAIKRLHPHLARDPEFVAMLLDEARLVARIKHPNVVPTLDVVAVEGEVLLVMDYVPGATVSRILIALGRRKETMPTDIAVGICLGVLDGLHAAHEAKSEDGAPLEIVHRDVSPQNIIVGTDGVARMLDFGIAKAAERLQTTEDGALKGKLGYIAPDVLSAGHVDRRSDIWGVGVVLWEMLVGRRLFATTGSPRSLVRAIMDEDVPAPSSYGVACPAALDAVVERALRKSPSERFATAREMAAALEKAAPPASNRAIADWLAGVVGEELANGAAMVEGMERSSKMEPPSLETVRSLASQSSPPPDVGAAVGGSTDPTVVAVPSRSDSSRTPTPARGNVDDAAPASAADDRTRRSGRSIALVVAAVLVVALGLGFRELRRQRAPAGTPLADSRPPASGASVSESPDAPAGATPRASASTSAGAGASAEPPSTPVAPPASARGSSSRGPGSSRPTAKACDPPYTIGPPPDYIRKPKLECFAH